MTAAIVVLLGDSSLPGMTECRVSMVMVKLAPCAAMTVVTALPRRDHGCQHLPQPIICSLHCLHSIMLIHRFQKDTRDQKNSYLYPVRVTGKDTRCTERSGATLIKNTQAACIALLLPQPVSCSLYCLHSIMLIPGTAAKTCLSEPHASQASKGLSLDTSPARFVLPQCCTAASIPTSQQGSSTSEV